jgi:F-type H+-transporting ATPase subunit epsilon
MPNTFQLKIATADHLLTDGQATFAEIPCTTGNIGVLRDHAPLVSELGAGTLTYSPDDAAGTEKALKITGGFIQVLDNCVQVLADSAEIL